MTQSSIIADCMAAARIGKSGAGKEMADNYLLDVVKQFQTEPRLERFFEDLRIALDDTGETLTDAQKIRAAIPELSLIITRLNDCLEAIEAKAHYIISERQEAGIMQEGIFELYPLLKHENRKPDVQRIKTDYPAKWDLLLNLKIETLKESYTPNQSELKTVFGKSFETMLIPAQEVIVGYDIRPILPEEEP